MADTKDKKTSTTKTPKGAPTSTKTFGEMMTDRRIPIILGILLLLFSFMLAMSLSSYVSSYQVDESTLTQSMNTGTVASDTANQAGPIGARIGAIFFDKLFGFASFLFVIIFGALGINLLLRRKIFKIGKIVLYCLLFMIWFSVMASFAQTLFSSSSGLSWGGAFGEYFTAPDGILCKYLKVWITGILLCSITLIALVIMFNFTFDFLGNWWDNLKAKRENAQLLKEAALEKQAVIGTDVSIFEKDGLENPNPIVEATTIPTPPLQPNLDNQSNIATKLSTKEEQDKNFLTLELTEEDSEDDDEIEISEDLSVDDLEEEPIAEVESETDDSNISLELNNQEATINTNDATAFEISNEVNDDENEHETPLDENTPKEDFIAEEVKTDDELDELSDFDSMSSYMNSKGEYDPTLGLSRYKFPDINLLQDHGSDKIKIDKDELEKNKNQIIQTLINYKIEISKIMATVGPTVTLYEIVPAPGVRISKIKSLEDDIALSLAALGIRIIAPIPGKGTIGIEVPNVHKEIVSMKSMIASEKFRNSNMDLPICLGKTISNEIFIADLAKMPHLLMAGATGQGKSVGINSILVSLLYKRHPAELKFVLVDPKKVELSIYSAIEKHFLAKLPGEEEAIITDTRKVVATLNALCIEMDNRYDLLKKANVRNLKEYNAKFVARKLNPLKGHDYMPLIVVIVDEFADLIMTAGKEVETPIARLAQLARAIGIHLVLATQRPSVNIITGTIKANFPGRISFKVASKIDSRTILDMGGADQLIGRGDMLLSMGSDLIRLQCGFVDTPEVDAIVNSIGNQDGYGEAFMLPEVVDENNIDGGIKNSGFNGGDRDDMFEDAARVIVQNQMGSTSLIQRRLKLGYNRAGRLMDQLEEAGIVGPNLGSKAREVLYNNETDLERFLNTLK
jgi:S-DNA-T family DNA segregation ATPase FtsK/SpoIIIE